MIDILQKLNKKNNNTSNTFRVESKLYQYDSLLKLPHNEHNPYILLKKAPLLLKNGEEEQGKVTITGSV
jgi:hypothetical protein